MEHFEDYPFWDLIAEEAYLPPNRALQKGTYEKFQMLETGKDIYMFGCNDACSLFLKRFNSQYHFAGGLTMPGENGEAVLAVFLYWNQAGSFQNLTGRAL